MGLEELDELTGRVILHEDLKFDYTPFQIRKFVKMWEDGESGTEICRLFNIIQLELFFLVSHCEVKGWIKPRPGGIKGTKKKPRKKREKIVIDDLSKMFGGRN